MLVEMQDTQQRTISSSSFSSSSCGDDFFVFSSDGSSLAIVLSSSGRTSEPDSLDNRLLSRAATEVPGNRSSGSSSLSLASSVNDSVCMRAFRINDWRRGGAITSESEPSSASSEIGDDDTRFLVALRLEEAGVPVDKLRFFFVDTGGELSCIKWSRMSEPLIGDSEVYCTNESHIIPTQMSTSPHNAPQKFRKHVPSSEDRCRRGCSQTYPCLLIAMASLPCCHHHLRRTAALGGRSCRGTA